MDITNSAITKHRLLRIHFPCPDMPNSTEIRSDITNSRMWEFQLFLWTLTTNYFKINAQAFFIRNRRDYTLRMYAITLHCTDINDWMDIIQHTCTVMRIIKLKIFPVPVRLHSGYDTLIFVIISPFFCNI